MALATADFLMHCKALKVSSGVQVGLCACCNGWYVLYNIITADSGGSIDCGLVPKPDRPHPLACTPPLYGNIQSICRGNRQRLTVLHVCIYSPHMLVYLVWYHTKCILLPQVTPYTDAVEPCIPSQLSDTVIDFLNKVQRSCLHLKDHLIHSQVQLLTSVVEYLQAIANMYSTSLRCNSLCLSPLTTCWSPLSLW